MKRSSDGGFDHDLRRISNLRDNTLVENYQPHDIAEAVVTERLIEVGYTVQAFGDDKRHEEDVYSGSGVDLQIDDGEAGYVEVKSKRSEEWLGRMNEEHWMEYRGFAAMADTPVLVYFALVDDSPVESTTETDEVCEIDEGEEIVERDFFVEVPSHGDPAETLPFTSKGHRIVELPEDRWFGWPTALARLCPPNVD